MSEQVIKQELIKEMNEQEVENFKEGLNWLPETDDYNTSWKRCIRKTLGQLKKKSEEEFQKLFLLAHSKDSISGKPQPLYETYKTIPLIRKAIKKDKDGNEAVSFKLFNDSFDKRYDGYIKQQVNDSFMTYKIIDNGFEYYVLSKKPLGTGPYLLTGMEIEMPESTEFSRNLKIPGISRLFLVKDIDSAIKTLDKKDLIALTKELHDKHNIDKEGFRRWVFSHPDGNVYLHDPDYDLIKIAQQLSGEYEGYGLHILQFGQMALGKTIELECLNAKYKEDLGIYEAGTSKLKGLIPSFKENPIRLGYCLGVVRIGLVDELMKMIANSMQNGRAAMTLQDHLSQLNMLLEQKTRSIGSGNTNMTQVQQTAKLCFYGNPLPGRCTIGEHVGIIDGSTMSRLLPLVIDEEYIKFFNQNEPIFTGHTHPSPSINNKKGLMLSIGMSSNIFLSIIDSSKPFLSNVDFCKIKRLFATSVNLAGEPMKSVWKGRGFHHSVLLLDGIVKYRCLFRDFDETFKAIDEDYDDLERILIRIVKGWETHLIYRGVTF